MNQRLGKVDVAALALALLLMIGAVVEWVWPRPLDAVQDAPAIVNDPSTDEPPVGTRDALDYRVVAERPLFTVNRKPYVVPVERPVAPPRPVRREPEPAPTFALSALIRTPGAEMAIVSLDGRTHKLRPGEVLDGWTLREVGRDAVVFARNGKDMTVQLNPDREAAVR